MTIPHVDVIVMKLRKSYPVLPLIQLTKGNPFQTLITTILSQRSKDSTTLNVARKLFEQVGDTPADFEKIPQKKLERLIYPSGVYTTKAKNIKKLSHRLVQTYSGHVPNRLEDLLRFDGVGRKTANIVLSNCFAIPAIAVDTHVHRISNRLGWVHTITPAKTEFSLMRMLPKKYWREINHLLVRHGQDCCKPRNPHCERCIIHSHCKFYKNVFQKK